MVYAMLGVNYADFAYLPAAETRGGILIAARQPDIRIADVLIGCYSITVSVQSQGASPDEPCKWWLTSVYGPQDDRDKASFLEELEAIRDACPGPWAVNGDFNLILSEADKSNDRIDMRNLRLFRRTVAALELQDLHLHGRAFTWSNEQERPTLVRLDRVLASVDWDELFPHAHLRGLGSDASDHCPLLLQMNLSAIRRARFHFEIFWIEFDDYEQTVNTAWRTPTHAQDPFLRLDGLLRNLVRELQRWSATKVGDVKAQLLMARELIRQLDTAQETRQLSDEERGLRSRTKLRCLGLSSLERTIARQRSRVRQLAEGDANTAYFHLVARGRKRKSYIHLLAIGDHVLADHQEMESALHGHFAGIFGTPASATTSINLHALGIQSLDLTDQDHAFTEEEVWAAIKDTPSDRAPGPDGFTGAFYKSSWHIIKTDVMAAIHAFAHADSRNLQKLNNALIVLIPKKPGARSPGDFRPITMIHSFAKLISKVLARRLAPRLSEMVAANQNAFVRERTIHDNFKYVQRAAVLIRSKKIPMLLLKLDISKAFDTLSWPFLLDVLRARGFSDTWRRWMAALLSTASSKILLNGHQGPPIQHRRGVRQGDSLSPMLFIIAMDVLHRLFIKAGTDGVLRPLEPAAVRYQCSFYADDVILFIWPTRQEATAVKTILQIFSEASGLHTNLAKCSITPIYGGEENLADIVSILGCQVQQFPIKHLGLPLSVRKIPKAGFQSVVEAVARKLPPCHGALMARSGRLVWIKSVLRAVPIYSMMAENLPPWARKEIDAICRKFFWAGREESIKGKCLVAWPGVCRPTSLGGLGISDLKLAGFALQTRWLWLQKVDNDRAWSQLPIKTAPEVQGLSSGLQHSRQLETAAKLCSGKTDGSRETPSPTLHPTSPNWCPNEFRNRKLLGRGC